MIFCDMEIGKKKYDISVHQEFWYGVKIQGIYIVIWGDYKEECFFNFFFITLKHEMWSYLLLPKKITVGVICFG